jgi:hypothetical protein
MQHLLAVLVSPKASFPFAFIPKQLIYLTVVASLMITKPCVKHLLN